MQIPRTPKDLVNLTSAIFRKKELESVFLFVTSRCNSLCRTCFYWDQLNKNEDLSFDQMKKISETSPNFGKLWLSGGEPFLREDLGEIVKLFHRNNKIHSVNLPTNGLLPDKIEKQMDGILKDCPDLLIDMNFSIDGLANTHDTIRGVPNNFRKTLETMDRMEERYAGHKNLRRNVLTVITRESYDELIQLGVHLHNKKNSVGQYFEIVRGEPLDPGLKNITRKELKTLHDKLLPLHRANAERLFADLPPSVRWFPTMYLMGSVKMHFDIHEECLERPQKWAMNCTAGVTTAVIDHNGEFRACEMRPAVGKLQDFDFDMTAALNSDGMKKEIAAIPKANCWCTHSCWIQSSMKFSPKVLLFKIPWAFLKYKMKRLPAIDLTDIEKFHEPLPVL
jgi:MoaA/NifB/PqqE/SkfB family radical SAM enzyme